MLAKQQENVEIHLHDEARQRALDPMVRRDLILELAQEAGLVAFSAAIVVQLIELLPIPQLHWEQLPGVLAGLALFVFGLSLALKHRPSNRLIAYVFAVALGFAIGA